MEFARITGWPPFIYASFFINILDYNSVSAFACATDRSVIHGTKRFDSRSNLSPHLPRYRLEINSFQNSPHVCLPTKYKGEQSANVLLILETLFQLRTIASRANY